MTGPKDALDPGPDGTYPWWPRKPDGSWDELRMPTGERFERRGGRVYRVDVTPRHGPEDPRHRQPIVPPGLTPPR